MTTRALMMRAVVICARSHKIVGFPDFYDVSIAKKSKVNSKFSPFSFSEFFFNFAHFEILTLPFTYYLLEKFWLKIRNHVISVNPSERPHIFSLENVSQNHFHKIGKFK